MLLNKRNVNFVLFSLMLLSVSFLQRISFMGTSLGMLLIFFAFIISIFIKGDKYKIKLFSLYILSLFPFYGSLFYASDSINVTAFFKSILSPLLIIVTLCVNYRVVFDFAYNKHARLVLHLIAFVFLLIVAYETSTIMSLNGGTIKKTYQFSNPNYIAFSVIFLQSIWFSFFLREQKVDSSSLIFMTITCITLLLTLSKSAYLTEVLFLLYFVSKIEFNVKWFLFFICLFVLGGSGLAHYLVNSTIFSSSVDFLSDDAGTGTSSRLVHISKAYDLFIENAVFGIGRDSYMMNYGGHKTHNIFSTLMAEAGLIGLVTYISFLFYWFHLVINKNIKKSLSLIVLVNYFIFINSHADGELLVFTPIIMMITLLSYDEWAWYKPSRDKT